MTNLPTYLSGVEVISGNIIIFFFFCWSNLTVPCIMFIINVNNSKQTVKYHEDLRQVRLVFMVGTCVYTSLLPTLKSHGSFARDELHEQQISICGHERLHSEYTTEYLPVHRLKKIIVNGKMCNFTFGLSTLLHCNVQYLSQKDYH